MLPSDITVDNNLSFINSVALSNHLCIKHSVMLRMIDKSIDQLSTINCDTLCKYKLTNRLVRGRHFKSYNINDHLFAFTTMTLTGDGMVKRKGFILDIFALDDSERMTETYIDNMLDIERTQYFKYIHESYDIPPNVILN